MNKNTLIFILLTLLLVVLALFSLSWGRFAIPIDNVVQSLMGNNTSDVQNNIIFNLRLPRILAAILVGAALAVAGATFQGIFRNPLVSPDLLGVSSGACIGAAIAILLGFGLFTIQGFAFVGGLIAVLMTMSLPKLVRRDSTIVLVLSGIIIAGFMMACLGLIKYLADPETQLKTLSLIKELSHQQFSIIMTTHNPDHPMLLHDVIPNSKVAILNTQGKLHCGLTQDILTEDNLRELYQTDLRLIEVPELGRKICAITHI